MKTVCKVITAFFFVLTFSGSAFGGEYLIETGRLNSLDHWKAYSWEFDLTGLDTDPYDPSTEHITEMTLTFENIKNWNNKKNKLYISALDSPGLNGEGKVMDWDNSSVLQHNDTDDYRDGNDDFINYFRSPDPDEGATKRLLTIRNLDTSPNDVTVTFVNDTNTVTVGGIDSENAENRSGTNISDTAAQRLFAWAQDGIFELGFDPDCHFYASNVSLALTTASKTNVIPEPGTFVLFGIGLLGAGALGRKKMAWENAES